MISSTLRTLSTFASGLAHRLEGAPQEENPQEDSSTVTVHTTETVLRAFRRVYDIPEDVLRALMTSQETRARVAELVRSPPSPYVATRNISLQGQNIPRGTLVQYNEASLIVSGTTLHDPEGLVRRAMDRGWLVSEGDWAPPREDDRRESDPSPEPEVPPRPETNPPAEERPGLLRPHVATRTFGIESAGITIDEGTEILWDGNERIVIGDREFREPAMQSAARLGWIDPYEGSRPPRLWRELAGLPPSPIPPGPPPKGGIWKGPEPEKPPEPPSAWDRIAGDD